MRSLTLVELIIVIIIIGILATLAMPQFAKTKERALSKEAIANLKLIASAERIYRMEYGSYKACECQDYGTGTDDCDNTTNGCNCFLKLSLVPTNWTYSVDADGNGTAQRVGKTCKYELAISDAIAGKDPAPVAGTGCP